MKIKPKLYLNGSPQTAEEGSLAYARNMKLDDDGVLVSDYGFEDIDCTVKDGNQSLSALNSYNIVGKIVGLNNTIYFFCYDAHTENNITTYISRIIEYNEVDDSAKLIHSGWTYSEGTITGYVSTNQSGEIILTVAEYKEDKDIPLKHINLKFSTSDDDESLYCQAPEVPIANLKFNTTYIKTIPNGVYVFFIRYKIREGVYTNWFLCSRPIFGGTSEKLSTLQGGLKYINIHKDSAKSFVFDIEFLNTGDNLAILERYSEFQLGFIITHDEATDARIWKSFPTTITNGGTTSANTSSIYFDYEDVQETNIDDMLATTYELYNVKNIASFKNKLYIGNYKESDLNVSLPSSELAVTIGFKTEQGDKNYERLIKYNRNGNTYHLSWNSDNNYFTIPSGLTINKDDYIADFTPLSKENVTEKECVSFDLRWDKSITNVSPELAAIYNVINNTIGDSNRVFGDNMQLPFWDATYDNALTTVRISSSIGDKYVLRSNEYNEHPWYPLGFTFMYGSVAKENTRQAGGLLDVYKFNISYENDWIAYQSREFSEAARAAMDENIKKELNNCSFFIRSYIEFYYGTKAFSYNRHDDVNKPEYIGYFNQTNPTTNTSITYDKKYAYEPISENNVLPNSIKEAIKNEIFTAISGNIIGLDSDGNMWLSGTESDVTYKYKAISAAVHFKKFEFIPDIENIVDTDEELHKRVKVTLKTTNYVSLVTIAIKNGIITVEGSVEEEQKGTLMPFSKYQGYIHLVDKYGIVTKGTPINQIYINPDLSHPTVIPNNDNGFIKLTYTVTNIGSMLPEHTDKYKAFFISLENVGPIVINCFGYTRQGNVNIVHCLESDALLYNLNDNITLINSSGTEIHKNAEKKYYSSGSSYPPLAFGNCGFIMWTSDTAPTTSKFYVKIDRDKSKQNVKILHKATPYIELKQQTTAEAVKPEDLFSGSYLCNVKKPDFLLSSDCYVAGSDIYSVNRESYIRLTNFEGYVQANNSVTYCILSNFNLNYLSLTEDINDKLFSIGNSSSGVKQVSKVINSANLSYIYELKSMYKDFMNKTFRPVETGTSRIQFDNTIRVSNVLSDETFNNSVFKFSATDYYNIPTDRGVIVNLFSIGNIIYVHTKGSLYKFDATQTITASDSDISLQEAEPFDAGINQVFDSQYGYGGIDNKEAGCITFDSYFFYDRFSNHIFAYGGNSQVQLIDGSIYKLLNYYKPTKCNTLHDEINHRVLFHFEKDTTCFTLSYNYKSKSFVSFHDLTLDKAFSSRLRCYSYNTTLMSLFNGTKISAEPIDALSNTLKLYGGASKVCTIYFGTKDHNMQSTPFSAAIIVFPENYIREVLNNIKYIGYIIKDFITSETIQPQEQQNQQEETEPEEVQEVEVESESESESEEQEETPTSFTYDLICNNEYTKYDKNNFAENPVNRMYIITDSCRSNIIKAKADDGETIESYKLIKHDIDSWNVNYFRNILHANNVYSYPGETDSQGPGQPRVNYRKTDTTIATAHPNSDNNSFIYGRFFIINFNFIKDQPVKFEEIIISTNQY